MQSSPSTSDRYTNDADTLLLARILNYQINYGGMCAGIATMGMQAMLAEDINTFEERRNFISSLMTEILQDYEKQYGINEDMRHPSWWINFFKDLSSTNSAGDKTMLNTALERLSTLLNKKIETFIPADKEKWLEIKPYFDGMVINYDPDSYSDFLTEAPRGQNFRVALPITTPVELDQSGIHEFEKICFSFNFDELKSFLEKMKDNIFALSSSSKSIIIGGSFANRTGGHAITIGYDPKKMEWTLLDSMQKLIRTQDINILTKNIFNIFQNNNHVNLLLDTYGLNSEKEILTQPFNVLKNTLIEELKLKPQKLNQLDNRGKSLLHLAVEKEYDYWVEIILNIIQNNPSIQFDDLRNNNLLAIATRHGNMEMTKLLFPYCHNINLPDTILNQSLLISAIEGGNIELIKFILANKANVNEKDIKMSPLLYAIQMKDEKITQLLLEYGANPNLILSNGYTITQMSAIEYNKNNSKILPLLIQYGGDINRKTKDVTSLELIKNLEDSKTIKNFPEMNAKDLLSTIQNHIETFPWKIKGLFGGEEITLADGSKKNVPTHVAVQWNTIQKANKGQMSYSQALTSVIITAQHTPSNERRAKSTIRYYGLFTTENHQKMMSNLSLESKSKNTKNPFKK